MRQLVLGLGLALALGVTIFSCDSDVETQPQPTTGGAGGVGGQGGDAGNGGTGNMGGNPGPCDGITDPCEAGCCHVEEFCGVTGACGLVETLLGTSCTDTDPADAAAADCVGTVLTGATCEEIIGLALNASPDLLADLTDCMDNQPCLQCAVASCSEQAFGCQSDDDCAAFITCAQMNGCLENMDPACIGACAAANQSAATTALVDCVTANCDAQCLSGGGGMGGGGMGGGGAGGTGGGGNGGTGG